MTTKSPTTCGAAVRSSDLLACPFCGSKANVPEDISVPPSTGTWWQIMCSDERKTDCCAWRAGESPEAVARKWNSRAMPEAAALMEIVEGVRGERWSANGRRLVDTPEWCALYVAWRRQANDKLSHGPASVEGSNDEEER